MKSFVLLVTFFVLTACGSGSSDGKGAVGLPGTGKFQPVRVPGNAIFLDYICYSNSTYKDVHGQEHRVQFEDVGTERFWTEGEWDFSYEEASGYKTLTKVRRQKLDQERTRVEGVQEEWILEDDGDWAAKRSSFERVMGYDGGYRVALSNSVNGMDTPYYWKTMTSFSGRSSIIVSMHTNPGVKNTADRTYTSYDITCTYTER